MAKTDDHLRQTHLAILTGPGTKADKARALFGAGVTMKARISDLLGGYSVGAIANALAVKATSSPATAPAPQPDAPKPAAVSTVPERHLLHGPIETGRRILREYDPHLELGEPTRTETFTDTDGERRPIGSLSSPHPQPYHTHCCAMTRSGLVVGNLYVGFKAGAHIPLYWFVSVDPAVPTYKSPQFNPSFSAALWGFKQDRMALAMLDKLLATLPEPATCTVHRLSEKTMNHYRVAGDSTLWMLEEKAEHGFHWLILVDGGEPFFGFEVHGYGENFAPKTRFEPSLATLRKNLEQVMSERDQLQVEFIRSTSLAQMDVQIGPYKVAKSKGWSDAEFAPLTQVGEVIGRVYRKDFGRGIQYSATETNANSGLDTGWYEQAVDAVKRLLILRLEMVVQPARREARKAVEPPPPPKPVRNTTASLKTHLAQPAKPGVASSPHDLIAALVQQHLGPFIEDAKLKRADQIGKQLATLTHWRGRKRDEHGPNHHTWFYSTRYTNGDYSPYFFTKAGDRAYTELSRPMDKQIAEFAFGLVAAITGALMRHAATDLVVHQLHWGPLGMEGEFGIGGGRIATFKAIYAGGHTIQCLHYRYIVHVKK